jgi:hypothetical protein
MVMKCPMCGGERFFMKDPDDPYETYPFEFIDGQLTFDPEVETDNPPKIRDDTETFCEKCVWHGKLGED